MREKRHKGWEKEREREGKIDYQKLHAGGRSHRRNVVYSLILIVGNKKSTNQVYTVHMSTWQIGVRFNVTINVISGLQSSLLQYDSALLVYFHIPLLQV